MGAVNSSLGTKTINVVEVTMSDCVDMFDERLFALMWFELRDVLVTLKRIEEIQLCIKDICFECKDSGIGLTVAQLGRVNKMCETMDSIPQLPYYTPFPQDIDANNSVGKIGENSFQLFLHSPDQDMLTTYVSKTRGKLKLIEDMASSKKNDNIKFSFSGRNHVSILSRKLKPQQIFDSTFIRQEIKVYIEQLELLELAIQQGSGCLKLIANLKQEILLPYLELHRLSQHLSSLEATEEALREHLAMFETAEREYETHRTTNEILQQVLHLQQDAQATSQDLNQLVLQCQTLLRQFSEWHVFEKAMQQFVQEEHFADIDYNVLSILFGLNNTKLTVESLAAILQTRNKDELQALFLKFHECIEFSLTSPSSGDDVNIDEVRGWFLMYPFDEILLLQERLRHNWTRIDEIKKSTSFEEAVSRLQSLRHNSKACLSECEFVLQRYRQLLGLHQTAAAKISTYQANFIQCARDFLAIEVKFVASKP